MQEVRHRYVPLDGVKLFYREAGQRGKPTILLLHGFPSSSIQFRYLLAELSDRWHVLAPDMPGFGFTTVDDGCSYRFTFDHLAETIRHFLQVLNVEIFGVYLHDYGAQAGFRLLTRGILQPHALIVQNSEAYRSIGWHKMMWGIEARLHEPPEEARAKLLQGLLNREGIEKEFLEALPLDLAERIDPAVIELGWRKLSEPGIVEAMLDLHMDYSSNFQNYPNVQAYFRQAAKPMLLL